MRHTIETMHRGYTISLERDERGLWTFELRYGQRIVESLNKGISFYNALYYAKRIADSEIERSLKTLH